MTAPDLDPKLTALMPYMGNADTIEGEIIRAYCKINYRHYNDGDLPYKGYGAETSGPALLFLQRLSFPNKFTEIARIANKIGQAYNFEEVMCELASAITSEITLRLESGLTPNSYNVDMYEYAEEAKELWGDDEEEECCDCCGSTMNYGHCDYCEGE